MAGIIHDTACELDGAYSEKLLVLLPFLNLIPLLLPDACVELRSPLDRQDGRVSCYVAGTLTALP